MYDRGRIMTIDTQTFEYIIIVIYSAVYSYFLIQNYLIQNVYLGFRYL